jgi:hypothetical protein
MHVRVVRFTDVSAEKANALVARIDEADGPPEGVITSGLQMLHDEEQGTAVVIQMFDSAKDMQDAEKFFDEMDSSETPGTRASIDRCEMKLDLKV